MTDFAPHLNCCEPIFYLGEVAEWRHSVTCQVAPGMPVRIEHGHCSLHPSESLFDCRGCIATAELRREQEEGIV